VLNERHRGVDAGAEHGEIEMLGARRLLGGQPGDDANAMRAEGVDLLAELLHFGGIKDGNHGCFFDEQVRRGFAAFAGPEHCDGLVGV